MKAKFHQLKYQNVNLEKYTRYVGRKTELILVIHMIKNHPIEIILEPNRIYTGHMDDITNYNFPKPQYKPEGFLKIH